MRMGVLTRYLVRIHLGPFLFSMTAITGLIFLNAVAQRMDRLVGKGLSWDVIGEFLMLSLPHTLALSLPMSVLVAVLYAFSELTGSNEITAMSAGGVRPLRIMIPLLGMGALATAGMLYFNDSVLPEANHRLKNLLVDIGRKSPTFELREQVVNEIRTDNGLDTYFLTAERIDPSTNTLENVTIFDANNPTRRRTTYAERGTMEFNAARTDLYLTLYDGEVHEVQGDREGGFQRLYFDTQVVPLRGVGDELDRRLGGTERGDREMSFGQLRENAGEKRAELAGVRADNQERSAQALRLALNRPTDADTALVSELRAQAAQGRLASSASPASLLSRDQVTQRVVVATRTNASRATAIQELTDRYTAELHKKWAISFACLIFTLMGPPLALRFPRGGVGMVVVGSTIIFALYWIGLIGGENLADRRVGNPVLIMWAPNLFLTLVGLWLVSRMGRAGGTVRGGGGLADLWYRALDGLRDRVRGRRSAESAA